MGRFDDPFFKPRNLGIFPEDEDVRKEDNWVNRIIRRGDAPHRGSSSKGVDDWSLRLNKTGKYKEQATDDVKGNDFSGAEWADFVPPRKAETPKQQAKRQQAASKQADKYIADTKTNIILNRMGLRSVGELGKELADVKMPRKGLGVTKKPPTKKTPAKNSTKKKKNDNDYYFNILNR